MCQFTNLEINQQVAFQYAVVKNQIDIKEVLVELKALLTTDKGEAFAKFKEERLKIVNNRFFDLRFMQNLRIRQPEKIEYIGIFNRISRRSDLLTMSGKRYNTRLISALEKSCEKEGMDLMFEVIDVPAFILCLDLIEKALIFIFDIHQGPIMGPA